VADKPTTLVKAQRNADIVRDRARMMSWDKLAKKYGISDRQARRVVADWRDANKDELKQIDPLGTVLEILEQYEAAQEELSEAADKAREKEQYRTVVAAVGKRADIMRAAVELRQAMGLLPKNLGKLRVEFDINFIAAQFVRIMEENDVPVNVREELVAVLERGS
jgi:hypothetical protein